jgi:hypothetical protein
MYRVDYYTNEYGHNSVLITITDPFLWEIWDAVEQRIDTTVDSGLGVYFTVLCGLFEYANRATVIVRKDEAAIEQALHDRAETPPVGEHTRAFIARIAANSRGEAK